MTSTDGLETFLIQVGLAHEQIDETTWIVQLEDGRASRIAVRIADPIVLFTIPILNLKPETSDREGLFRRLLELNANLLFASYALEHDRIVLSGAQQLDNLDLKEFQAVLDDITLALDKHLDILVRWSVASVEVGKA